MLTTVITVVAAMYLLASLIALAPRKPGYSHIAHSISEIGEVGAPNKHFVAFGLFLPIGLVLLLVAYLVRTDSPAAAALALYIAIGYIGAAAFPCDPGSPLFGTVRQVLHNLAGAVEYVGGGFALVKLAESFGQPFKAAGFVVLGTAIALSVLPSNSIGGLIQRIAEICLFGGLALAVWWGSAV
ncbi:DUF998 domain-containing protein [Cellvibrio polysaccharolyticus]|uniref:DUF998 domain-containing protein n=1 Tax=Cellvibrio polysaccharolyticus TaxID=2082724 RepID=A0A928YUC1_9GAMM|nr:DUF998 domain-containing protein [Cellvibrio polysaccharolyticus]MBE8715948.1 DUF998 domain-containing protein [Cellvibrio polysaccharolyticus]